MALNDNIFSELEQTLIERKTAQPDSSYVASLYHKGLDSILKKVEEEAAELIIAAKSNNKAEIIYEVADLWFHTMVLLVQQGIKIDDITNELSRRFGVSGLVEKANRK